MESSKRWPVAMDKAPGKELIQLIVQNKSFGDFEAFYRARVGWHSYPLIHDMFYTFGLFEDLFDCVPEDEETASAFLGYALAIAEKEDDKLFINGLFLILDCCLAGGKTFVPSRDHISRLINLKSRVVKLSTVSNMLCFWDQVLDVCARDNNFDKTKYLVSS